MRRDLSWVLGAVLESGSVGERRWVSKAHVSWAEPLGHAWLTWQMEEAARRDACGRRSRLSMVIGCRGRKPREVRPTVQIAAFPNRKPAEFPLPVPDWA